MGARALIRLVPLFGGCCVVIAGLLGAAVGTWMLTSARSTPDLTVVDGSTATLPKGGFLRGNVPVYADEPTTAASWTEASCRLVGEESPTAVDDLFFATGDEVSVDGRTWYPLVEVSLDDDTHRLTCAGVPDSATMAVGEPRAFSSWTSTVAPVIIVFGGFMVLFGAAAVLVAVLLGRSASTPRPAGWQSGTSPKGGMG